VAAEDTAAAESGANYAKSGSAQLPAPPYAAGGKEVSREEASETGWRPWHLLILASSWWMATLRTPPTRKDFSKSSARSFL